MAKVNIFVRETDLEEAVRGLTAIDAARLIVDWDAKTKRKVVEAILRLVTAKQGPVGRRAPKRRAA